MLARPPTKPLDSNPSPTPTPQQAGNQIDNPTPPPSQGAIFSNFSKLPPELRQLIWKAALPSCRIILLEHKERYFDADPTRFIPRIDKLGFRSHTPMPSVILVCREAYKVGCLYYTKAFTNKTGTSIPETYFDFTNDFLYLGPEWVGPAESGLSYPARIAYVLANELHPFDLSRVNNLAVWWNHDDWGAGTIYRVEQYLAEILCHFGHVKHVTLVNKIYRPWGNVHEFEKNADLRFLDPADTSETDIRAHGHRLPGSSTWLPHADVDMERLKTLSMNSGGHPDSPQAWKVPRIYYNMLVSPEGEQHLIDLALGKVGDGENVEQDAEWELRLSKKGSGECFVRHIRGRSTTPS